MPFVLKRKGQRVAPNVTLCAAVTAVYQGVYGRDPTVIELSRDMDELERGASFSGLIAEMVRLREPCTEQPFVPPGHYYSPVPPRAEVERHLSALDPNPDGLPGINLDRAAMVQLWNDLVPMIRDAPFTFEQQPSLRYRYDNGAFSWGDGLMLHALLRHIRPKRLIEVGSGWSSACIVDTNEYFLDSACEVTCIEPYPALLHETVGVTLPPLQIIESGVQTVPLSVFEVLCAGDILFIDSTHVLRTGGDVTFELLEVLPRLAPGVFVHFHDMFWPFEYPWPWAVDENRAWNEIYAVRAFLCENSLWRIVMFNDFFAKNEAELIGKTCPAFLNNPGGGLWLERRNG